MSDRYEVKYVGGRKPYVVKNVETHKIVGRSHTRENAEASARARYAAIGRQKSK